MPLFSIVGFSFYMLLVWKTIYTGCLQNYFLFMLVDKLLYDDTEIILYAVSLENNKFRVPTKDNFVCC